MSNALGAPVKAPTGSRLQYLLTFLSPALQVMPLSLCINLTTKVILLCGNDDAIKTLVFLVLETLFAGRKLPPSTVEGFVRNLFDS